MLELLTDLPPGVDGVRATGTVTRDDYTTVVRPLLESAREHGRRLRFLYDFAPEFSGFTPAAGLADARIGLTHLREFERCAVVTDSRLIRESARLVGAMLPCPVRTFPQAQRAQAVDWLRAPARDTVPHRVLSEAGVLLVEPVGRLKAEDFDALTVTVDRWVAANGPLRGLVVRTRRFPGWQNVGSLLRHLRFVRDHHRHVLRVAIVADGKAAALAPAIADFLVDAELQRFPWDQLDDAVHWAGAGTVDIGRGRDVSTAETDGQSAASTPTRDSIRPEGGGPAKNGLGDQVRGPVAGTVNGRGVVVNTVSETVSGGLTTARRRTGAVGVAFTEAVAVVASGAFRGASQAGADLGQATRGAVIGVLRGTREVGGEAVEAAGETVRNVVHTSAAAVVQEVGSLGRTVSTTMADVARDVIRGAANVGGDIGSAAAGTMLGVLRHTRTLGQETAGVLRDTAGAIVRTTAEVGGDVGTAARSAVEGAIRGAGEIGVDAAEAASATATGALRAAGDVSESAVEQVRRAATGAISGVKVVVTEPFRRDGQAESRPH
jgi:hypothetical protein